MRGSHWVFRLRGVHIIRFGCPATCVTNSSYSQSTGARNKYLYKGSHWVFRLRGIHIIRFGCTATCSDLFQLFTFEQNQETSIYIIGVFWIKRCSHLKVWLLCNMRGLIPAFHSRTEPRNKYLYKDSCYEVHMRKFSD